jgi:hypothetical protein
VCHPDGACRRRCEAKSRGWSHDDARMFRGPEKHTPSPKNRITGVRTPPDLLSIRVCTDPLFSITFGHFYSARLSIRNAAIGLALRKRRPRWGQGKAGEAANLEIGDPRDCVFSCQRAFDSRPAEADENCPVRYRLADCAARIYWPPAGKKDTCTFRPFISCHDILRMDRLQGLVREMNEAEQARCAAPTALLRGFVGWRAYGAREDTKPRSQDRRGRNASAAS